MNKEAIEEAIEVLEDASAEMLMETGDKNYYVEAITALRQALETEQQPVAWTAMAFARLGEVRDKMRPDDVRIVQQFLDGDYTALEKALQTEQEPFEFWSVAEGWVKIDEVREHFDMVGCGTIYKTAGEGRVPLYTAPPKKEWVGLDEEDWDAILYEAGTFGMVIRVTEAKLKEKNT